MKVNIEYFIQITFVLLVLSMINEKLVNFIKLHFPDNWLKRTLNFKVHLSKYATVEDFQDAQQNKRTREVQTLATLMGIAVALACRANLFRIYDPTFDLSWFNLPSDYGTKDVISDILGSVLTGFFLSLGSKFFHDLLGIILETKNLKRKLSKREAVSNLHTMDEVDTYLKEVEPIVVENAIADFLKGNPKVQRFEYSEVDDAADVYLIDTTEDEAGRMQRFLSVSLANKTSKAVELNYILM